jgi:hypothetical protein
MGLVLGQWMPEVLFVPFRYSFVGGTIAQNIQIYIYIAKMMINAQKGETDRA